jgi:hypothetical protein
MRMSDEQNSTAVEAEAKDGISQRLGRDIITAMKAKDEHRLTTLRMVKAAL